MSATAPSPVPLRVGYLGLSDCAPLLVASALGLDRRHGVQLELRRENSWAALRDALVQGSLDAAHCLYGLVYGVHLGIGGRRHPMHLLMGLAANGQSITLSTRLARAGLADGAALAAAVRDGRRLSFAHTWPTGTHAMWLYYWLASHGIHPLREVRMTTVPPAQMVARLEDGSIDGCCVGEPWGALAVASGVGVTVATSQQVWPDHPEKVLAAGPQLASRQPQLAQALVCALLEACRELDRPDRRAELATLLARPGVVDLPLATLLPRFTGWYDDGLGHAWSDAHALRFFDQGRVNCPRAADGLWFVSQFRRWAMLPAGRDWSAAVADVQQTELFRRAAEELGIAIPAAPARVELCDGVEWTGRDPEAYADAFAVRG